ncbi:MULTISPECIES: LysR family transcriptional regulator [Vibrio]|mgnify:CR=1 FL=1|uniref:Putative LysR family transcriptional regulator n=1 Tax=Vibrio proteolyticus NBRC 13287 TaxID=1219065 RepID=U3B6W7_VIBPR|nr:MULTISPECIES: LysR family transcriptional regulator [Vibrio]NAW57567.1 LysR family transcriptional regulator [Vibrio sp. V36_P2S2PM302]NAX20234.1 LysR family transcriptional regulator [Vibrio sp. V39_P1S14PM300]NAX28400.1 LysR family transcriptional regulator [Vibrio sp. V38_P2S17PM301]NAX30243.1 LysR family transcriptional regulator [Vibrio sp. V37_P2S8PM304]GAD65599.1 putative LysR family transcriptional regulator [Vibrio proteolyticus NBRC 13287]
MDYIALSRISLKHLTVFHVLLNTHSVTATAQQLCASPSGISKVLSQLRSLLKDELFYRDGTRLVPTPFALSMGPTVHGILSSMNGVLHHGEFDPQQYSGDFAIGMRGSSVELFAPLLSHIAEQLNGACRLNLYAKEQLGFEALLRGQADFIILPHDISQPPTHIKDLVWKVILDDEMVCLMNAAHPLADTALTIDSYLSYQHVGVHDRELSRPFFEQQLAQHHRARDIALSVADFGAAAIMCQHMPYLFTCSKRWANVACQTRSLIQKNLPFDYGHVAYSLVWNKQSLNDPAQNWLHQQLQNTHLLP